MENRFLTLFPCCNLPLFSYSQTLRINLCPFFLQLHFKKVFPVFPLSYHRTLPRRLPTGISKLPSDCWFRISYDIRTYQFDQIPKEYYIPSQNTKIPNITPSMAAASIKWYQHPLTLSTHISWFPTFVGTQFEQQPLLYGLIMVCIQ